MPVDGRQQRSVRAPPFMLRQPIQVRRARHRLPCPSAGPRL